MTSDPHESAASDSTANEDRNKPRIKIGSQRAGAPPPRVPPRVKTVFSTPDPTAPSPAAQSGIANVAAAPSESAAAESTAAHSLASRACDRWVDCHLRIVHRPRGAGRRHISTQAWSSRHRHNAEEVRRARAYRRKNRSAQSSRRVAPRSCPRNARSPGRHVGQRSARGREPRRECRGRN